MRTSLRAIAVALLGLVTLQACGDETIARADTDPHAIAVDPATLPLKVGETVKVTAVVTDLRSNQLTVTYTWASSAPAIAAVDQTGNVTGNAEGAATVTVTYDDPAKKIHLTATTEVTVRDATPRSITVEPDQVTFPLGEVRQLTAKVINGSGKEIAAADAPITWTSEAPTLVSVDETGKITADGVGTTAITATSGGVSSAPVPVTVLTDIAEIAIAPSPAPDLATGKTQQFTAKVTDAADRPLTKVLEWTSSDEGVASVDRTTGLVTALAAGTTKIKASAEGKSDEVGLIVFRQPVVGKLTPDRGPVGTEVTIEGQAFGTTRGSSTVTFGTTAVAASDVSAWSDTTIVLKVPPSLTPADYPVTVTVDGHPSNADKSFTVQPPVAKVALSPTPPYKVQVGAQLQLSAITSDAQDNLLSGRTAQWKVADGTIATVSPLGMLAGVAVGTTTVTATVEGISAEGQVVVFLPPEVQGLSPGEGPPTTQVTITGTRFGNSAGSSTVSFGETPVGAADIVSWSDGTIVVKVPAGVPAGDYPVVVTVDGHPSNADQVFKVLPAVATLEFSPAPPARLGKGRTFQTGVITKDAQGNVLTGRTVTYSSSDGAILGAGTSGLLTGVEIGTASVIARSEGKQVSAQVAVYQPATVTAVVPSAGPSYARVRVEGLSFGVAQGSSTLVLRPETGDPLTPQVLTWSDRLVEIRIPPESPLGTYAVVVTVDGEASNTDKQFTVNNGPYVLSVSPRTAVQGSLVTVTIQGNNLATCPVAVNRNGSPDANIVVDNASKVVERFGAPGLPDEIRVNVEVKAAAALGDYAVSCGASLTTVNDDNRFSVTPQEGAVLPVAGNGTAGSAGDGSTAASAQLSEPSGLALGSSGELYVADTGNNRIRVINTSSTTLVVAGVTVPANGIASIAGGGGVAGNNDSGYAGDNSPAKQSKLNAPAALAYDKRGVLYVADTGNHCVRAINLSNADIALAAGTLAGGNISKVAGGCGTPGYFGDGGVATGSRMFEPKGLALSPDGLLYVADSSNHRLRVVNTTASDVTNGLGTFGAGKIALVAGSSAGYAGDRAAASSGSLLNNPSGLALDDAGMLYIADTDNNAIRAINTSIGNLTLPNTETPGVYPLPVWVTLQPGYITTALGAGGAAAYAGDGACGPGGYPRVPPTYNGGTSTSPQSCARLVKMAAPVGLATGPLGELYFADQNNNRIRHAAVGTAPLFRAGAYTYATAARTVAGDGSPAKVFGALGVAYAPATGTLYIANTLKHRIDREVVGYARSPFSGELGPWPADLTSGTATLDVDTGVLSYTGASGPTQRRFGITGGVFSFSGKVRLFNGTTLTITGTRPVILAATGDLQIEGTLLARNGGLTVGVGIGGAYGGPGHGAAGPGGGQCRAYYVASSGGAAYGRPELVPVTAGTGPGDVGGALVLSAGVPGSSNALKVSGSVRADSGTNNTCSPGASGGGIRLVGSGSVQVSGTLSSTPGAGYRSDCCIITGGFDYTTPASTGANGRIRIEAPVVTTSTTYTPAASIDQHDPIGLPWM